MSQPKWIKIVNLGDVCPIEYGGYFVYRDANGAHTEEMEYLEAPEDDNGKVWHLHRIILLRCTDIDGVLSDNKFHPEFSAWFAKHLPRVASTTDHTSIRSDLCSADPVLRAMAYKSIATYHGWENLDPYPLTLNETEVRTRYPEYP